MAEVAKVEKGPSVMAPMIKGMVDGLTRPFIHCFYKPLGLQLEFKVVSPEFPAVKDLFAALVNDTICMFTRWLSLLYRDHCLLSLH